ncbi:MAG: glycosyl hydrolase, partial [Chthoniobacterales bacterium]
VYYPNIWKAANPDGSPQGTIDKGVKLAVKGDIPYHITPGDILLGDFEAGYPAGSTITGNGFPTPPSAGSGVTGFMGAKLASTRDGGNGVTGTLSLPNFTVNKHYLHFLISGGNTTATQVRLVIGGTTVLAAPGANSNTMAWVSWDLTPYTGQTAHVEVVDTGTSTWGYIACDQLFLSDASSPAGRFGGNLVASNSTVTAWGDWSVDFSMPDAFGNKLDVTMARGVPFTWTRWTGMNPKIALGETTTFYDTAGAPIIVTNGTFTATSFAFTTSGGKTYGIYLPDNTVCTVGGSGSSTYVEPNLTGGNYMVIGYLPAVGNLAAFGTYAYARPTDTQITWTNDAQNGRVRTTWNVTTTAMKGSNLQTIQGFLPHQYRTTTANFSYQPYTWQTQRGIMKAGIGTGFQLDFPFNGLAISLPAPQQLGLTNDFQPARMEKFLDDFVADNMYGETYGSGKSMYLCAKYMVMADEMGDTANFNRCKDLVTAALQNWLTYTPGESLAFFTRYDDWKALIGWDASYGSQAFNDLHFHYGYFIATAALLGKYDKTFLTQYGPMLRLVAKAYANYDRTDLSQPFLRMFDVWEGHSNAGGLSSFNGENQESSSEAMNSWIGLYLLGSMLNDSQMTAAGAMGFSMEGRAVNEYWTDLYQTNFGPNFNRAGAGMVWSDNFTYATYFSGDPAWVYGIQYVPSSHWANYLVHDQVATVSAKYQAMWNERVNYIATFALWNSTTAYPQNTYLNYNNQLYWAISDVPAGDPAPDVNTAEWGNAGDFRTEDEYALGAYLGDYILGYRALWDHTNTPSIFDDLYTANKDIAKNRTGAGEVYYLIHALRQLGDPDTSYSASVPTATVYYNATTNTRTAVVYNPNATTTNVSLYKNGASVQTISVPGYSSATAFVGNTPAITSTWSTTGMLTVAFNYQITATNSPTSYSVTGTLPAGLSLNPSTGLISGTPTATGTSSFTIKATNANGTGSKNLTVTIYPFTNPPVINSSLAAPAIVGAAFSYQIAATNSPFSYDAAGLPTGLSVNQSTGLISGTPTAVATTPVTIKATNAAGTATATLSISALMNLSLNQPATASTVAGGSAVANANDGSTNTRWTASSAAYPQWWRVDLGSGKVITRVDIRWYSSASRSYKYKIEVSDDDSNYTTVVDNTANSAFGDTSNAFTAVTKRYVRVTATGVTPSGGTASAYEITAAGPGAVSPPAITSATSASGSVGTPFSYQITATNSPTSYALVSGTLPAGLSLNPGTGLISGTPTAAGTTSPALTIGASNAGGQGTAPLTITITQPTPVITSASSATGEVGQAFNFQLTATNNPTSFNVVAGTLPAGLTLNPTTGVISGTPTAVGTTSGLTVRASNGAGAGSASGLTITINGNLALTQPATASSVQAGSLVASGNDSSTTTRWTASGTSYPQWWRVDLGASKTLTRVDIMWYSSASRAYKYKLETSPDDATYTMVFDNTGNTTFGNTSNPITATAQYVRVTVTGSSNGGFASFFDLKVFGH